MCLADGLRDRFPSPLLSASYQAIVSLGEIRRRRSHRDRNMIDWSLPCLSVFKMNFTPTERRRP